MVIGLEKIHPQSFENVSKNSAKGKQNKYTWKKLQLGYQVLSPWAQNQTLNDWLYC